MVAVIAHLHFLQFSSCPSSISNRFEVRTAHSPARLPVTPHHARAEEEKRELVQRRKSVTPSHVQMALGPLRRQAARLKILTLHAQTRRSTFNFLSILRTILESLSHT